MGMSRSWHFDVIMSLGLIACMSGTLIGEAAHEWLGTVVLVLFVWHFWQHRRWFAMLNRGRYHANRVLGTLFNGGLCFTTLGLCASSIMLSQVVFAFLPLHLPQGTGLTPHQICAAWGFLWAALHLGQHTGIFLRRFSAVYRYKRIFTVFVAAFAVWAIGQGDFLRLLFLQQQGLAPDADLLTVTFADGILFLAFTLLGAALHHALNHRKEKL